MQAMNAEERRTTHLFHIKMSDAELTTKSAGWAYDALLAHFDDVEPALANAIRYGLDNTGYQDRYVGPLEGAKEAMLELGSCVPDPDDPRWQRESVYRIKYPDYK